MSTLHDDLLSLLPPDDVYPVGVVTPIRPRLRGRSFFPGGSGHGRSGASASVSAPVMLVGQDFGTLEYWNTLVASGAVGDEGLAGTWAGLESWHARGVIDLSQCFLTNALLGVRNDPCIVGPSPGLSHDGYVRASLECLEGQIRLLRPRAVVALGTVPTALMATRWNLAPGVRQKAANWTWRHIDGGGLQFVEKCEIARCQPFAFGSAVHPCLVSNDRHRAWPARGLGGRHAQDEILRLCRDATSG